MSNQLATKQLTTLRPTQNKLNPPSPVSRAHVRPPSTSRRLCVWLFKLLAAVNNKLRPSRCKVHPRRKAFIVFARWQHRLTWRGRNIPPPTDNAHTNKTNTNTQNNSHMCDVCDFSGTLPWYHSSWLGRSVLAPPSPKIYANKILRNTKLHVWWQIYKTQQYYQTSQDMTW